MIEFRLTAYNALKNAVQKVYTYLRLEKHESKTGRPLAIGLVDSISLATFKQRQNIVTNKSLFEIEASLRFNFCKEPHWSKNMLSLMIATKIL